MMTVIRIVTMFMMNVNRRYLAMRGMLTDVGGKIFETRSKKTTRARRIEIKLAGRLIQSQLEWTDPRG